VRRLTKLQGGGELAVVGARPNLRSAMQCERRTWGLGDDPVSDAVMELRNRDGGSRGAQDQRLGFKRQTFTDDFFRRFTAADPNLQNRASLDCPQQFVDPRPRTGLGTFISAMRLGNVENREFGPGVGLQAPRRTLDYAPDGGAKRGRLSFGEGYLERMVRTADLPYRREYRESVSTPPLPTR
jgi:hypothetical protein